MTNIATDVVADIAQSDVVALQDLVVAADVVVADDRSDAPLDALDASVAVDVVNDVVVASADTPDVVADVCTGVVADGGCETPTAPRLLSPLSGAISGSHRPLLRWVRSNVGRPQTLRFCADRACTRSLMARALAGDLSAEVLDADLPSGPVFWRVETTTPGGAMQSSATWEFFVSGRATRSVFWYGVPDFDGDGVADLVVGAFGNASELGRAYGYPAGRIASGTPAWTMRGADEPRGGFGYWVQSVGDVNGDGFVDLGVSALRERGGRGTVRVFLGSPSGLAPTSTMVLEGTTPGENFGALFSSVGDVNGDGYADLAVGIPGTNMGRGACQVFFGGPLGVSASRTVVIPSTASTDAFFGGSIAPLGDLNGDGFDDFAVGAPGANADAGAVWVLSGTPNPTWTSGRVQLMSSSVGRFGFDISTVGDVDRDGRLEFVVSAPTAAMGQGRVYVYSQGGDTISDTPRTELQPTSVLVSQFGAALAGGMDLNGDEAPDLAIGAPRDGGESGRVGIYLGGQFPLIASSVTISRVGEARGSFGSVISLFGDGDRDGLADLAVSAPRDNGFSPAVFVYRGSSSGVVSSAVLSVSNPEMGSIAFGDSIAR